MESLNNSEKLLPRLRRRGEVGLSSYEQILKEKGWLGDLLFTKMVRALSGKDQLISEFGFAIPCEEAVLRLAQCPKPIVEVGAGLAYWASLVYGRYSVNVDCYDKTVPPYDDLDAKKGYRFVRNPYHKVMFGDQSAIGRKGYQTLLLIWPDYGSPMALDCLRWFKGNTVVYVGESDGGCTADDSFHAKLDEEWFMVDEVEIPQWYGIHDWMRVFQRKAGETC